MKAILFGPFVGEMYWEVGRFAPMLPHYKYKKYKGQDIQFIVFTREERFDMYGKNADILVPLRIDGDYDKYQPNCFRLDGFSVQRFLKLAQKFKNRYRERFNIVEHIYPDVSKGQFVNKNQFPINQMMFKYKPRDKNFELVNNYMPNDKSIVILAPRYRKGFKRNWGKWQGFYDRLAEDPEMMEKFNYVICGKPGEYIPDEKKRFYDMNDITIEDNSSLIGLLFAFMKKAYFTFGSQSAIPNISLLFGVEVLEFGCQKRLHTKTYNIKNTPITFIDDRRYNIEVNVIYKQFKTLLIKKKEKENEHMGKR